MPSPNPVLDELTQLRTADPVAFRTRIREALTTAGSLPGAAAVLTVPLKTLHAWTSLDRGLTRGLTLASSSATTGAAHTSTGSNGAGRRTDVRRTSGDK